MYDFIYQLMGNTIIKECRKKQFENANAIQKGAASYNLACIYGLRTDKEACLKTLESARDAGTLPDAGDILNDPDLIGVKDQDWFIEFMESLNKKAEVTPEDKAPVFKSTASKWKLVEKNFNVEESDTEEAATTEENTKEEAK